MRVLWSGLALALVLVGGVVGYRLGTPEPPVPTRFTAAPVPASSPSYPVIPVRVVADPDYPTLEPGLPLRKAVVGAPPFEFRLPIPKGWLRTNPASGEWRWYPGDPDDTLNTYFIRVKLLGNQFQPVSASLDARISALQNADDVDDLHIESRDADGFVANYVSGDHRRITMEHFIADDTGMSYASIGVIGRKQDRRGLADLAARLTAGAQL